MSEAQEQGLSALLHETRTFPPPDDLAKSANAQPGIYAEADADRLAFWEAQARRLTWAEPWSEVLEWNVPFARWFIGGKLNVSVNCVDRHVETGLADRVAFHWEGEPGDTRTITYADLLAAVSQAANALTELGVRSGDKVAIYMPMIPETVVAMLACARLGAPHTVVFGGFSSDALRGRILDCDARFVITADGGYRRGTPSALKPAVDDALAECPNVRKVLVVQRTGQDVAWDESRDVWWHDVVPRQSEHHEAEAFDAEHPLYIMYTSGTTAKPKGILHTSGGYLTHVSATHRLVFDLKPETDVFWTAADIGWVTGHSYIVYGPLANGTTSVMYEGTPDTPTRDRWWQLIEKYKVNILYTAPTTIRTFMKWGEELPAAHDLSSLRLLGSVGEPINPEAWIWYRTHIGGERCPIVDTWWQTETGGIMITPLPGVTATKPGAAMTPFPAIAVDVIDNDGRSVDNDEGGYLVLTEPWPGMLRGIYGDEERYRETYWSRFPGRYFAGDGAKRDQDGDLWLLGRVDDVMNISGHRISTTEVEHALVSHPAVAEAAVVGADDATTGQAIVAFVTVKGGTNAEGEAGEALVKDLRDHVAHEIGPIAKPRQILLTPELPKTRSGKIMRRLLRDVADHRPLGDVTTLLDPTVVNAIKDHMAEGGERTRSSDTVLAMLDHLIVPVSDAEASRIFLYTQKTGVPVYIPLPSFVVDALNACPRKSERYWFWTGVGSKETLAGNWRRTFRRLCKIAGVKNGHPHRFRDTLAVELLLEGVPIERVSALLGHSSVKITERHYAPWVQARQAQLEADVARAWRNDPIAQAEMLRGEAAFPNGASQRMAATYPRHERGELAN